MNNRLEDKDSPALKARLQALGFEQVQFEPKISNRFIVYIDTFPSYVIKGFSLPRFTSVGWEGEVELECYNPLDTKLEQLAMALVKNPCVKIKIKLLTPTADVDTEWDITGKNGSVSFGNLNWSNSGDANLIYIRFEVDSAEVSYPKE